MAQASVNITVFTPRILSSIVLEVMNHTTIVDYSCEGVCRRPMTPMWTGMVLVVRLRKHCVWIEDGLFASPVLDPAVDRYKRR